MKVEKGMKFKGNINGVEFLITDVNNKIVAYKVLLNGSKTSEKVHTFGREAFNHLNITDFLHGENE